MLSVQLLGITLVPGKITQFFKTLIDDTVATREREGIIRPDLLHLLIQAKKGTLHEEDCAENLKGAKISKLQHFDLMCSVGQFHTVVFSRDVIKMLQK
jgi:Mg2+/Co2+ transporter CorC